MIGLVEKEKEGELNFASIMAFLNRYKKPIIIITLVAGILGAIFSAPYFIPPKYKSNVIMFPTMTNSISKTLFSQLNQPDLLAFGEEAEAEQLLQVLESEEIKERIIEKYKLREHYRINPNSAYPRTILNNKFNENVKFRRTEYMSVEIAVMDESKDTAALIANDIANLLDSVKTSLLRERAMDALKIVEAEYKSKEQLINMMVDSLQKLGDLGVQNYEEQPAVLSEQYAIALRGGNSKVVEEIERQQKNLAKYGPIHRAFSEGLREELNQLTILRSRYDQAKVDVEKELSHKFIINKAVPAEKKSYPVRWLIVLISAGSAFGASVLAFAFWDNYKRYRRSKYFVPAEQREREFAEV